MKKILICAASQTEITPLCEMLNKNFVKTDHNIFQNQSLQIFILIHYAGIFSTIYHLTKYLNLHDIDKAYQIGIAGAYFSEPKTMETVAVKSEFIDSFGFEDEQGNLKEFRSENFIEHGIEIIPHQYISPKNLREVKGLTSMRVRTDKSKINKFIQQHNISIESMEGAAFYYVCNQFSIPCLQLRCISNSIGEVDRKKWKIREATSKLAEEILIILKQE